MRTPEPATAGPQPPTALDLLEAHTRAPAEAAERAVETLRATLAPYLSRASDCKSRLEKLRDAHRAELNRLAGLDYRRLHLSIGGGTDLAQQLQRAVTAARTIFEGHANVGGSVPSVLAVLDRIPGQVARLTAKDAHACPTSPPCGCRIGTIKATVENCELFPARFPAQMAAIADLTQRLERALARRAAGVEVLMVSSAPPVDRRASTQALTDFNPLQS